MEIVTVDLDVTSYWEITWSNEFHVLFLVFILSSLEEWPFDNTWILLSRFKDWDGVIGKVEWDNKSSINILWGLGIESCCISEDFFVVINKFKEVNLRFFGDQIVDVTKGIDFISEAIVWRNLNNNSWSCFNWFDISNWEVSMVSVEEVILGEYVYSADFEDSTICSEVSIELDFITGKISVTNELLTWLIYVEYLWQFLSSEVHWKWVSSVIREMNFSDFDSVVSKEIVPNELKILRFDKESQNFSIVVKELLLRWNSTTAKFLF